MPEDEAGFIALHLVNAQTENNDQSNLYELTKTMQDIINIVKYYFKTTFDEESVYFIVLLRICVFVSRMQNHSTHAEETDDELLEMVKIKYRNAYQCVQKSNHFW